VIAAVSCSDTTVIEDETTDVIVEHVWHDTTEHVWHTTTVTEEDTTPDVLTIQEYHYPSGPVPCLVLMEEGVPAMADGPVSGLAAATTINDPDLLLITQSGTSKKIAFEDFPLPTNYIGGLITSNDAGDTDHDIAIAPGSARGLADDANLRLAAILTKQIDAAWAVGDDQGGIDTGSVAADTLYAVWLIKRSDTGVVDALFSTSFTSPTMPTDYDKKRLIGAVQTEGSANIVGYLQSGDYFRYFDFLAAADIVDSTITSLSWETGTLRAPPKSLAMVYAYLANGTSTSPADGQLWLRTKGANESIIVTGAFHGQEVDTDPFQTSSVKSAILVDANSQIEYAAKESTGSASVQIQTVGFTMFTRREP
jgi:hypothetical protein